MKKVDRWLLPDGIEEVLPEEASRVEGLRRRLVDLFQSWGYDYVIPPMVEFIDSLLTGSGEDAYLDTFKITDQLSGKTMGIRADITPQAARMDAHSLQREGLNRLCYAGHVMYTKPKGPLASRTPIQVGVELFGESGLDADIEVISLLLETLEAAGLPDLYIDIGHVGVYRALIEEAGISKEQEEVYFELLQAKSINSIESWVANNITDAKMAEWLLALPRLAGGNHILAEAKALFEDAPAEVSAAIDELEMIDSVLTERYPHSKRYFDLSELRGYHYYTGVIFGAFAPGLGNAIANGGRYDHIGEAFGRARAATGFAADLMSISRVTGRCELAPSGIYVEDSDADGIWAKIKQLRASGERVVCALAGQTAPYKHQHCNRKLIKQGEEFVVAPIK